MGHPGMAPDEDLLRYAARLLAQAETASDPFVRRLLLELAGEYQAEAAHASRAPSGAGARAESPRARSSAREDGSGLRERVQQLLVEGPLESI